MSGIIMPVCLKAPSIINQYNRLRSQVYEFTDFLVNVLQVQGCRRPFSEPRSPTTIPVPPCGSTESEANPAPCLEKVRGLELVEMPDTHVPAADSGAPFSIKHEPVSTAMAQQKVENALSTGAEYIVSTETSCLMHLDTYITKAPPGYPMPAHRRHSGNLRSGGPVSLGFGNNRGVLHIFISG
jgi:L-lactate dehydrogenase complex protein LldE